MQKIIIVCGRNPEEQEEKIEKRLAELDPGWEIESATTAITSFEEYGIGQALHIYFTTTIILKTQKGNR